jgi:chaperonin GroEL (HSP60 family)
MAEAAKGINPEIITEEIAATTEEIVAEVKEEAIEAPSRLREKFRRWEALWGRTAVQFYKAPKL